MKIKWKNIACMLTTGLLIFLLEGSIYNFIFPETWVKFWIVIPIIVFALCYFLKKLAKPLKGTSYILEISNLVALVFLFINVFNEKFADWFSANFQLISFFLVVAGIAGYILHRTEQNAKIDSINKKDNKLFNLFYLNTSKAHEIAMLIDNTLDGQLGQLLSLHNLRDIKRKIEDIVFAEFFNQYKTNNSSDTV